MQWSDFPEGDYAAESNARPQEPESDREESPPSLESSSDESDPEVHEGAVCDHCDMQPILGPRFKCASCEDVSLCKKCYKRRLEIHRPSHRFFAMKPMKSDLPPKRPERGAQDEEMEEAERADKARKAEKVEERAAERKPSHEGETSGFLPAAERRQPEAAPTLAPAMVPAPVIVPALAQEVASQMQERLLNMGKGYAPLCCIVARSSSVSEAFQPVGGLLVSTASGAQGKAGRTRGGDTCLVLTACDIRLPRRSPSPRCKIRQPRRLPRHADILCHDTQLPQSVRGRRPYVMLRDPVSIHLPSRPSYGLCECIANARSSPDLEPNKSKSCLYMAHHSANEGQGPRGLYLNVGQAVFQVPCWFGRSALAGAKDGADDEGGKADEDRRHLRALPPKGLAFLELLQGSRCRKVHSGKLTWNLNGGPSRGQESRLHASFLEGSLKLRLLLKRP